jgi:hypothetical protein
MADLDIGLMPFQEQIDEYPALREMLLKAVRNPSGLVNPGLPWRVYGQREGRGRWAKRDFETYVEAFRFLKPRLKTYHDISITSKARPFDPPGRLVKLRRNGQPLMVKTNNGMQRATKLVPIKPPPGHLWCMYCRRFTVFIWFTTHHAFKRPQPYDLSSRRCCVCGIREVMGAWRH